MIKVLVLILCINCILGYILIAGGNNANIKAYPYQLSLQYKGRHFCGAAIIDEIWALTAAHCTDGLKPEDLTVRAASSFLHSDGQVVKVKSIYIHPQYDSDEIDYDIALLKLEEKIKFTKKSSAITLVDANSTFNYEDKATVTGWGDLNDDSVVVTQLQVVRLPLISQEECISAYFPSLITSRMFCAGYEGGGKDACHGDSGGPLVVAGKLAGLVSWGKVCEEPNYPGVYTNVAKLRNFVTEITGI